MLLFSCSDPAEIRKADEDKVAVETRSGPFLNELKDYFDASAELVNYIIDTYQNVDTTDLQPCLDAIANNQTCSTTNIQGLNHQNQKVINFKNAHKELIDIYVVSYGSNYLTYLDPDISYFGEGFV